MCMLLPGREEKTAVGASIATRQATACVGPLTAVVPGTAEQAVRLAAAARAGRTDAETSTRHIESKIRRRARIRGDATREGVSATLIGVLAPPLTVRRGYAAPETEVDGR